MSPSAASSEMNDGVYFHHVTNFSSNDGACKSHAPFLSNEFKEKGRRLFFAPFFQTNDKDEKGRHAILTERQNPQKGHLKGNSKVKMLDKYEQIHNLLGNKQ